VKVLTPGCYNSSVSMVMSIGSDGDVESRCDCLFIGNDADGRGVNICEVWNSSSVLAREVVSGETSGGRSDGTVISGVE